MLLLPPACMNVARIHVLVVVYERVSRSPWSELKMQYLLAFVTCIVISSLVCIFIGSNSCSWASQTSWKHCTCSCDVILRNRAITADKIWLVRRARDQNRVLLIWRTKFLMSNASQLRRITDMFLMFGQTCLTFFGCGEDVLFKWEEYCFISLL